ncbi:MAG TPA: hypothetical protein DEA32_00945 [Firmicutes bacterium]|nr:hypothetical protein [Bacillota bacterium]
MPSILRLLGPVGLSCLKRFRKLSEYSHYPYRFPLDLRFRHTHEFALSIMNPFRIKFIFRGLDRADDRRALFVFNHQSDFDPAALMMFLDQPVGFLAKKKVCTFPIIKHIVNATDGNYLDRSDLRQQVKTIREISEKLKKDPKMSFVIFPEGKRSQDPIEHSMSPYKPGAFKAAYLAKADIVVCALYGTYAMLQFNKPDRQVYPVQVSFIARITHEDYQHLSTVELSKRVEQLTRDEVARMRELQPELEAYWNRPENARAFRRESRARMHAYFQWRKQEQKVDRLIYRLAKKDHPKGKRFVPIVYTREDAKNDRIAKRQRRAERQRFIRQYQEKNGRTA